MTDQIPKPDVRIDDLTTVIEDFASIFIRLPSVKKLSFTTLSVLHTLSRNGPMRLNDLSATEQLTQPAITAMVKRLERDGLVQRQSDPNDGRVVLVSLTALGSQILAERRSDRVLQFAQLFQRLTSEEQRSILAALPALIRMTELGRIDSSGENSNE